MFANDRRCDQCHEVIADGKTFHRTSVEVLTVNGTNNTAKAFMAHDFCSVGCLFARVKEMLSSDAAVLQDAARKVSEAA